VIHLLSAIYPLVPFKIILYSADMVRKRVFLSGMSDTALTKHFESRIEIILHILDIIFV
jgi:hypothetical protein